MFWTEAVRTACYVLNRVLVTSPHNKTPYALLTGNIPSVSHFKPFGVYNMPNKRVEETMNLRYFEEKPNVQGLGHECIQGTEPKDTSGNDVDDSPLNSVDEIFQKELARLKGQEQRATSDVERLGLGPSDLGNHDPSPGIFSYSSYDDEFGAALNNVASTVEVSPVATKRTNTIHPQSLIIKDHTSAMQTTSKVKKTTTCEFAFISYIYDQQRDNHTDFQHYLFACFHSQVEPSSVAQAFKDPSWVDAMQEEMQKFKFQNVWVLVDLPEGKYAIGTKWILKNKRDTRGIVVQNKARLAAQGHRQDEGIDYDEVFTPVARIETIRLFLAFAYYMGFMVYQMDVKSAFLYGRLDKEAWCDEFKALMKGEFQMSAMGELTFFLGLQVQQRLDGMFISQDKYVQEILNKFDLESVRMTTTSYEAPKPKSKNESDSTVNANLSWAYGTLENYLLYLKLIVTGDYTGANKDRKSTTGGCQFMGMRLISWQCKKQTIVATSSTEAKYVAAANCCGQPNGSRGWISDFHVLYIDQVVVDEVIERYNATPPRIRLLQERIQTPLDSCMILSSARRQDGTVLLSVLMSGDKVDRGEHMIIPSKVPIYLVSPWD
nr:putative ribonuclease H-like domain-containing protein [Tanacetum cinerariifolium]